MRFLRWAIIPLVAVLGMAGWWILGSGSAAQTGQPRTPDRRAVPVEVAEAIQKPMPVLIPAIGRVQTIASVAVKSRIDGVIASVATVDGQEVKAGDVLFALDDRALQAAVRQADATLVRDRAQLENARREVERQAPLSQKDFVTKSQMDQTRTNAAALEGTVRADEAQLEMAKVALSYSVIKAPIDGRLGTINFKLGNSIKANDTTPLVTLNQIAPIYVAMSVPQVHFAALQRAMAAGPVTVTATVQGDDGKPLEGQLAYVENAIDTATNTLAMRASFANAERRLWPGQFVNATIVVSVQPDAVVVPSEAVQAGQGGSFVYLVKPDSIVEARPITLDRTIDRLAVISQGVAPGDKVVTNGQLRLDNGMAVTVRAPGAPPPPAPPAADKGAS
ncbi:MAG: efflux RND transporter periplasmic adaptor subunit [Alphaproteobacteria bacterium]|nr:efflux RND transporter periplasmic adaptor subunit [Alphaproteobacteria bacterium]